MDEKDRVFTEHILQSITIIESYVSGVDKEKFINSVSLQDMVFRRLEIIGEAVKNLSENFKRQNSQIEWKKIAGLRDVLIHNYFGVDLDLTWNIIKKEIPKLKENLVKIKNQF